jgi:DNA-binding MarR family transcriptional regulator
VDVKESLLKAVLATVSRQVFPPEEIVKVLTAGSGGKKQIAAYNLCDGATPQAEIGRRAGLDKGNLSRSISRWLEAGIVVRIGPDETFIRSHEAAK